MNNTDLNAFVQEADAKLGQAAQRRAAAIPVRRPWFKYILVCVLTLAIVYLIRIMASHLLPPSESQITKDLDGALERAHVLVDKVKADTGKLPDALPNAALASVVRYEPVGEKYRLSATILGVKVTLEPDGKKTQVKE